MSSTIPLVLAVKGPIFWSLPQFVVGVLVVVGFFLVYSFLLLGLLEKTYRCSSKTQFAFNCRGLTDVVSRFPDLT